MTGVTKRWTTWSGRTPVLVSAILLVAGVGIHSYFIVFLGLLGTIFFGLALISYLSRRAQEADFPPTNPAAREDEIIAGVLEYFQHTLRGLNGRISRRLLGEPPCQGFACQRSEVVGSYATGSVVRMWRITYNEIIELPSSFGIPAIEYMSRRYYYSGMFDFTIAPDRTSVVVGWHVGLLFGEGFRCRCVTDRDGRLQGLRLAERLWVS